MDAEFPRAKMKNYRERTAPSFLSQKLIIWFTAVPSAVLCNDNVNLTKIKEYVLLAVIDDQSQTTLK